MPELPEVETIRRYLDDHIVGKEIASVEILEKKQFVGDPDKIIGQKVAHLFRKGKVLYWEMSSKTYVNFHLKMSGEIFYIPDKEKAFFNNIIPRTQTNKLPNKFTRIIIYFSDKSALYFNDLRKFGWIKVTSKPEVPKGTDVLSKEFTATYLKKMLNSSLKPVKLILMDQEKMTGVGNIYANDILWQAKISPLRKGRTLKDPEITDLFNSIKRIINEGIKFKGSSSADEMYVLPNNQQGSYQNHLKVYSREGDKCLRKDGGIIKRVKQGGRSSFFCPECQNNYS